MVPQRLTITRLRVMGRWVCSVPVSLTFSLSVEEAVVAVTKQAVAALAAILI
jgi:hypothetical protein